MGRKKHPEPLTPAEQRVLEELRTGATNAEIAVRMGLSINTVKYHVANMLAKTGLTDRAELRSWRMPRDGGPNWWLRGAVAVAGLVGIVGSVFGLAVLLGGENAPDRGLWVAYSVRDGVKVQEALGGDEHLLDGLGMPFEWSPDGETLAALGFSGDDRTLVLVERRGWDRIDVPLRPLNLAWSPDSSRIAVATPEGVSILDSSGRTIVSFTVAPAGTPRGLAWSSDGSILAAVQGAEIVVFEADGGIRAHDVAEPDDAPPGARPIQIWRVEPERVLFSRAPAGGPTALQLDPVSGKISDSQVTFEQLIGPWSSQLDRLAGEFPEVRFTGFGIPPTTADGRGTRFLGGERDTGDRERELLVVVATPRGDYVVGIEPDAEVEVSVVLTGGWADPPLR